MLAARFAGRREKLLLEPGRSLVGNAGLLLTRVEYLKPGEDKNFAIVDAAMNDLMRPALYEAYHEIVAVNEAKRAIASATTSSVRSARPAIFLALRAISPSRKAIFWPCFQPAPTA